MCFYHGPNWLGIYDYIIDLVNWLHKLSPHGHILILAPIQLYTFNTPNGFKVSIYLELLQIPYEVHLIDIRSGAQKEPSFTKLNPNGRIPTIVDPNTGVTISQTGAILQYLAEVYDKEHKFSYKPGTKEYYLEKETLIFQVAENGPIQGQANHFTVFAPEKVPYGIERYQTDTKRIYGVYEEYLKRNEKNLFLVGDHVSTADVALYPWAAKLSLLNIDISQWPLLKKWFDKLSEIEAFKKGSIPRE